MKRVLAMMAVVALPAQAFDWPWQDAADVRYGYCKGFVVSGLAEQRVQDLSRTNLWLSWNEINRADLPEGTITLEDYQAGQAEFANLRSGGSVTALMDIANDDCGLGLN